MAFSNRSSGLRVMGPTTTSRSLEGAHVEVVNPCVLPDWDDWVSRLPGSTVFHTAGWARVLMESYRHRPAYLAWVVGGRAEAVLPMMEVSSRLTGRRGVSLPFSDYCGALGVEPQSAETLVAAAAMHGSTEGWRHLEYRGNVGLPDGSVPSMEFYAHEVDLRYDEVSLFEQLDSSVRRNIRKAEKMGVQIAFATGEFAVKEYYRLHCLTRRRHGIPPQPYVFFQSIQRNLLAAGQGFVALAYRKVGDTDETPGVAGGGCAICEGPPMAAAVFLHAGRNALYKFGASDERFQDYRANNLLFWRSLNHCRSVGCDRLHLGRTSMGQDGLRRFKNGWGARESQLLYHRWNLVAGCWMHQRDRATGWHARVFGLLPLAVNRCLGRLLYPHLD